LIKFGKNVGLSLLAVRSYFGQLLSALIHLQKHSIIHLDIKPDNILVSSDFSIIQIADFGSAIDIGNDVTGISASTNSPAMLQQPTPYLISRFYRSPEIMLGIIPITYAVDLWSLTVTIVELYIGDVVFKGKSNNDMLYIIQQNLGSFSNRVIKQHLTQCNKYGTQILPSQFRDGYGGTTNYYFTQQTVDPVTGVPVHKVLLASNQANIVNSDNSKNSSRNKNQFPLATPLQSRIMKSKSAKDSRKMVSLLSDLVHKCLNLDPSKRIALKDAIRHEFFAQQQQQPAGGSNNNPQQSTTASVVTK
jgi:serine/threonine-protein kinase PRP4